MTSAPLDLHRRLKARLALSRIWAALLIGAAGIAMTAVWVFLLMVVLPAIAGL